MCGWFHCAVVSSLGWCGCAVVSSCGWCDWAVFGRCSFTLVGWSLGCRYCGNRFFTTGFSRSWGCSRTSWSTGAICCCGSLCCSWGTTVSMHYKLKISLSNEYYTLQTEHVHQIYWLNLVSLGPQCTFFSTVQNDGYLPTLKFFVIFW